MLHGATKLSADRGRKRGYGEEPGFLSVRQDAKQVLRAAAVCAVFAGAAVSPASAQAWKPVKPVEIVVGSAPGGSPDIMARLVQNIFQSLQLVPTSAVVNKPGAANTIGWAYLNQHAGDGHYIAIFRPRSSATSSWERVSSDTPTSRRLTYSLANTWCSR